MGVSASGNTDYDSNIENTGVGGTSQGDYELRLTFTPGGVDPDDTGSFTGDGTTHLVDKTDTKFDGDADGVPGGTYNFWFNVQEDTVFVDKASTSTTEDGTLANPYKTIDGALASHNDPGTIIRVLGNNYYNDDANDPSTYADNVPYELGYDPNTGRTLDDGRQLEVPQGVTLVVDAGAMFKLYKTNIDVGSSAEDIDRSEGALQVLGTPLNSVIFTSFRDAELGVDIDPSNNDPDPGDWGGLVFRNELDYDFIEAYDPVSGKDAREVLETQGIFLNYVNHADLRYGGGEVNVDGLKSVYSPIHMIEARPTITYNRITRSADAALSADPNSFADTLFESWDAYAPFTADYDRVGMQVRGNYVAESSINGLFVRIATLAGKPIDELEVPGRFDDFDIVHVIAENLFINGTPGGPVLTETTNQLDLIDSNHIQAKDGAEILDQSTFSIFDGRTRVVFEFDLGSGVADGHIAIPYTAPDTVLGIDGSTADAVAASIRKAIEEARDEYGLDVSADVTETGSVVTLTNLGPLVRIEGFGTHDARLDARLQIDPGIVVKMWDSRIEMEMGSQLIAEGRVGSDEGPGYTVVFTSFLDDRYGAAGTFDTGEIANQDTAEPGDWGGLYFAPVSTGSIDQAILAWGGGDTRVEGDRASFNTVEIRQAEVRIANSRFENNAAISTSSDRNGRGPSNAATIQVRGAQPVIVNNDFIDNQGAVVSIDVNSLVSETIADWGRTTGFADTFDEYASNHGPLIRANRMTDNGINGMEVRAGTISTDSIWDDTDIVHVVFDEIDVPNYHHEGVLRLQSSDTESLVVKLSGDTAGFTAGGTPLEIDDRIGGTLQLLGQPGHPVVLTSLADDSVGAGFTLSDLPQNDTNNDGTGLSPTPGDWRSVLIDEYSNDRNVAVVNEVELSYGQTSDLNCCATAAQVLGSMALEDKAGDDNLRLGFEVHGTIRTDDPTDADVYTFNAPAGTEIWLDIDRTNHALDLVVELIKADGTVLARSDNSYFEELDGDVEDLSTEAYTMDRDYWLRHDFYSTNDKDAGMRLVLPGPEGAMRTYYVRVRSVLAIGAIPAAEEFYDGSDYTTAGREFTIADEYLSLRFEFTQNISGYAGSNIPVDLRTESGELRNAEELAQAIVDAVAEARWQGLEVTARVLDGTVVLDGMHVRFNGLDTPLDHLANTSGEYQLQIRLEEMQEVPGSTIQYADIRYATNGIEVYGQPGHSPLLGETAEVEDGDQNSNDDVDDAQQIGNLLQVNQNAISVAGYLENRDDVDWYAMSVDLGGLQSITRINEQGGVEQINDLGSVWATIFDIDYADQMARPDLNLWVFDSNRNLILAGGSSNVSDDRTEPIPGAQIEDLSRGSVGARDPFIGTALLNEGNGNRGVYYIAVTSTLAVPEELDPVLNPLTRLEPINSVNRIASEHFQNAGTQVYNKPNTDDVDDAEFMGVRLDPVPYEFTLGDTILYVSIGENLYTVDPFTGAFETEVTSQNAGTRLPGVGNYLFYDDIDMRNDGTLFTVESGRTGVGLGLQNPDVLVLSTEDATNAEQRTATDITFYRVNPTTPTALQTDPNGGIQFEAMVHDYNNFYRNIYAVGTASDALGLGYENLMYVLDSTGEAYTHPLITAGQREGGARTYSGEKVPLGQLYTAPTIIVSAATQSAAPYTAALDGSFYTRNDIRDGESFTVDDGTTSQTFEFDFGQEFFLDDPAGVNAIRDYESSTVGHSFMIGSQEFRFDSGPVLVGGATIDNYTTFTITGYVDPDGVSGDDDYTAVYEIYVRGTQVNPTPTPGATVLAVDSDRYEDVMPVIVAAINNNPNFSVTATLNEEGDRISLANDRIDSDSIAVIPGSGFSVDGDYTPDPDGPGGPVHIIAFDETDSGTQLGQSIIEAIAPYCIDAGYGERSGTEDDIGDIRDRLSIRGATGTIDMSKTPPFQAETSSGDGYDTVSGHLPVYINAGMTAEEVAAEMADAIDAMPGVTAREDGRNIVLGGTIDDGNDVSFSEEEYPLYATGVGGGGRITGLAYVGSQMYAIADNGDLFEVNGEHGLTTSSSSWGFIPQDRDGTYNIVNPVAGRGPQLTLIANISYDGSPIEFSGLTDGPSNAEDGAYAATLFATDPEGHLYCIDLEGNLLPIFNDGAERVQMDERYNGNDSDRAMGNSISSVDGTGSSARGAVTGLAFSPIDFNLWHATLNREHDLGHGVNTTYDGTRNREMRYGTGDSYTEGDISMYFGLEDPDNAIWTRNGTDNTWVNWAQPTTSNLGGYSYNFETGLPSTDPYYNYDLPGGAHGSFATTTFSLDSYSAQDKPTLYFNYYAETENSTEFDGLHVFISNDGAKWDLVATNTDMNDGGRRNNGIGQQMQTPTVPTRIVDEIVDGNADDDNDAGEFWRQARIDLSRYAGQDNLRLRFDVTTAGDLDIGETTGSTTRDNRHHYMSAVPAYEIAEYDTFALGNSSSASQTFEFDFGLALELPNVAGAAIGDGEWFVVDDGVGGVVTFEFYKEDANFLQTSNAAFLNDLEGYSLEIYRGDGTGTSVSFEFDIAGDGVAGDVAIPAPASTDAEDIAEAVVDAINGTGLFTVTATRDGDRIYLQGDSPYSDERPVADAETGIAVSSGYGFDRTNEAITINDTMTTEEVIQAMIDRINVSLDVEGVAPNLDKDPNRLFLTRAMDLDVSGAPHLAILGHAPVSGALASGNIRVPINGDMTQAEVGAVIAQVVNQQLLRTRDTSAVVDVYEGSPEVIRVSLPATNNRSFSLQGVTHRGELRTVTFHYDAGTAASWVQDANNVHVGTLNVATPSDLAGRIAYAINNLANTGLPELMVQARADTLDTGGNIIDVITFDLTQTPFTSFDAGNSSLSLWNADNAILNHDEGVGDLYNLIGWELSDSGPLGYSGKGGFNGNDMGELEGEERIEFAWNTSGDGRMDNRFNLFERGQDNDHEGFYIDDIIIGFTERGEMVTDASRDGSDTGFTFADFPNPARYPTEYPIVTEGSYQLEVRTGANYAEASGADSYPITIVTETMDTNDRMSDNFTLIVPAANEIHHGQWFELSDGRDDMTQRFVFVDETVGGGAGYGEIRIDFTAGKTADDMAQKVADAINEAYVDDEFDISAKAIAGSARVDLFGAVRLNNDPSATNPVVADGCTPTPDGLVYPTTGGDTTFDKGDSNRVRQKGQIVIAGNSITYAENAGIIVAPTRDDRSNADWPFPASPRTMNDTNELVPGVMIENNLVAYSGQVGIGFQGDPKLAGSPVGAVSFGRIVNNTVYGGSQSGIGIDVGPNASPTLLNNIVANLGTGIQVDTTSASLGTVIGGTLYKDNGDDLNGSVGESFAVFLETDDPLFVDADNGNFYLAHGSRAIDSSIDSMEERQDFYNSILEPIGIPVSPILAPEVDLFGQLRRDDPAVASPIGIGQNVFKDRGAIDRVDFEGPTTSGSSNAAAGLTEPLDNGDIDRLNSVRHDVKVVGEKILRFTIQLKDEGSGINDDTVLTSAVHVYLDLKDDDYADTALRSAAELVDGVHYRMVYNSTNDTIDLIPLSGLWAQGHDYTIVLDDSILDDANNALQPNRFEGPYNGLTVFRISLAGLDFGDAPDPDYPTLYDSDGPRHVIYSDFHLGLDVNSETDARWTADADGDEYDDAFDVTTLLANSQETITLDVTIQNENLIDLYGGSAWVSVWFDFQQDGDFDDLTPDSNGIRDYTIAIPVFDSATYENNLTFTVPAGVSGPVFARFRFGSVQSEVLSLTGEASDGEVEDYMFTVVEHRKDFGDAPSSYPVSEEDNGAWHSTNGLTDPDVADVYLGLIPPDSELDGEASPNADADDLNRTDDDEDGVTVYGLSLENHVFVADGNENTNTISVTVTGTQDGADDYTTAYLRAWLDLDANGEWDATNDLIIDDTFLDTEFAADEDGTITRHYSDFSIPALSSDLGDQAMSYARFRVSSHQGLRYDNLDGPGGNAIDVEDGEVEDYQVFIVNEARDYGDAPDGIAGLASYPTLIASNGASHAVGSLMLGNDIDADYDAHTDAAATGDNLTGPTDAGVDEAGDEDGITFDPYSRFVPGGTATIDVQVTGGDGYLYGWIDFNGDGDWDDDGEQVFDAKAVSAGSNEGLSIRVPNLYDPTDPTAAYSVLGNTFARFRLNSDQGEILSYDGHAQDGEVEDYRVMIEIGDATIQGKKFNDLNADGKYDESVQGAIPPITLDTIGIGPTIRNDTDDAWSTAVTLDFQFEYYGDTYDRLYVSPNGLVSFANPSLFNYDPLADPGFPSNLPIIAPFWANADLTSSGGTVHASKGTNLTSGNPFIQIDWNEVGYFDRSSAGNQDLRNTFSLYIEDAPAGDIVAFVYDTMQWTTGDNGGTDGFGGVGAEIGFGVGDGGEPYSEMRPNSQQGLTALLDQADLLDQTGKRVLGYRMDPATGLLAKGEPGLAGVTVYLDYDSPGDAGYGSWQPGEPRTVTRPDDLSTPDIDETGDFEFTGLFSGSYTVREDLSELDGTWIQTHPAAGPTYLPDVNGDKIQAIGGSSILDEDIFVVSNGIATIQLEFDDDGVWDNVASDASVVFDSDMLADQVALAIRDAINTVAGINLLASVDSANYPDVVMLTIPTADPAAVVSIDPQDTMLTVLGDNHINLDRSYTVVVDAGETNSEVLFGNHKLTTISVGNVSVAEGDEGETKVNLTFERRGSFGAEVTVDFHTENGTDEHDKFNAHYEITDDGDGEDYERIEAGSLEGTFTFLPQDEPQATWDLQAITHNLTNDYDYHVSSDTVVFEVADEDDWEILVYNKSVDADPIALTDNKTEDRFADAYRVGTESGSGTSHDPAQKIYVVWAGIDREEGQSDYEIFLSEVYVTDKALVPREWVDPVTGEATTEIQITHNSTDDKSPRVSGSYVTWWGFDEVAGDQEIFMSKITETPETDKDPSHVISTPVNVSENDYDDFDPVIDGDRVVWHALVGQKTEIFLYNGQGQALNPSNTRRVTSNQGDNSAPQIDGNYVVWQGRQDGDYDIFLYEIDSWNTTQLTTTNADFPEFDIEDDKAPQIWGENVVWEGGSASNREIYLYNIVNDAAANISDNSFLDERPQIHDERIVWHSFDDQSVDGHDWEVMFLDLSKPFLPLNVSNNLDYDWGPQVSDELLVWRSNDGQDYEIVVASQNDPVAVQTVELTIFGDYLLEEDEVFHVAIDDVRIDGITLGSNQEMYDDAQEEWGEISIYNDDGELDYGDAPASYHTLIGDNGARHVTDALDSSNAVYYLGAGVDAEDDGQPSPDADGDDIHGQTGHPVQVDEDGVSIRSHWIPGEAVRLVVTASTADSEEGYLTGWVDYDGDGNFGDDDGNVDREEQLEFIGPNERVSDGIDLFYLLEYVDTDAPHDVRDGWVAVDIDASMSANEVAEAIAGVINAQPDVENVVPGVTVSITATVATGSDEIALEFRDATTGTLRSTSTIQADEGAGILDPLTGPQVDKLGTGVSTFFVIVPDTVTLGDTYARFRFSSADGLNYLGSAPDGEVEDYLITITTDKPEIKIIPTDGATEVVEGGVTDTYSVVLTAKPMNTVWVNIAGDLDVETTETRLRFTRDNWNIAQTVTVAAIDDDIAEFIPDPTDPTKSLPHEGELTHTVDSLDLAYNEMAVDPVIVEVTDNDLAKVQGLPNWRIDASSRGRYSHRHLPVGPHIGADG